MGAEWLKTTRVSTNYGEFGFAVDVIEGVFLDMCSIYQYPRSDQQQVDFDLAMDGMQCLYSAPWAKSLRIEEIFPWSDTNKQVLVWWQKESHASSSSCPPAV